MTIIIFDFDYCQPRGSGVNLPSCLKNFYSKPKKYGYQDHRRLYQLRGV